MWKNNQSNDVEDRVLYPECIKSDRENEDKDSAKEIELPELPVQGQSDENNSPVLIAPNKSRLGTADKNQQRSNNKLISNDDIAELP